MVKSIAGSGYLYAAEDASWIDERSTNGLGRTSVNDEGRVFSLIGEERGIALEAMKKITESTRHTSNISDRRATSKAFRLYLIDKGSNSSRPATK